MARATPVAASITRPGGDSQYARGAPPRSSGGRADGPAMVPGSRARRRPGCRRIRSPEAGGPGTALWVPARQLTGRAPLRLQTLRDGLPLPTKRGKDSTHSYQGAVDDGKATEAISNWSRRRRLGRSAAHGCGGTMVRRRPMPLTEWCVVTVRAMRGLAGGARPWRGRSERIFPFRGNSAANRLRNFHDHGPRRGDAGTTRTKRAPGPGAKSGSGWRPVAV